MPMTEVLRPSRDELITAHRERYFRHAQGALQGLKEIRYQDDCGFFSHPIDHVFINGMESKLPAHRPATEWRQLLCQRIASGEPVPELDARLDAYVTVLTGRCS
jgi:hypothetical protein